MHQQEWLGLAVVAALGLTTMAVLRPDFLSAFNLFVLLSTISLATLVAFGQMMALSIGQLNLSLGAIGGLAAVVFAGLMDAWQWPAWAALVGGLVVAAAAGAINGIIISTLRLSAFIVTLATMAMFKGLNLGITQARPFYNIAPVVKEFGTSSLIGPVPMIAAPAVLAAIALAYILFRLPIGRQILAVGGNTNAAELSGISVQRAVVAAHLLSGLLGGVAGMVSVAMLQLGQPTIGDDWLISSFAAPVIGGVALTGGYVTIAGTTAGVVIVALITQGLVLFTIDPFYAELVLGLLILLAVLLNRAMSSEPGRRSVA